MSVDAQMNANIIEMLWETCLIASAREATRICTARSMSFGNAHLSIVGYFFDPFSIVPEVALQ